MEKQDGPRFVQLVSKICRSRLACTICAVHSSLQRESGTSLTIGAGPGTGKTKQMEHNISVGN